MLPAKPLSRRTSLTYSVGCLEAAADREPQQECFVP